MLPTHCGVFLTEIPNANFQTFPRATPKQGPGTDVGTKEDGKVPNRSLE